MISLRFFASDQSFLDPATTDKGEPYGPWKYKQLVRECYLISKNCNTSYSDLMDITPTERAYLLQLISDEIKKSQEAVEEAKQKQKNKRSSSHR